MRPDEDDPAGPDLGRRKVEQILARAGFEAQAIQLLAQGSTSIAWQVQTRQACLVLRIGTPHPGKAARFEADAGVRERLSALDARVAEPIATSAAYPAALDADRECAWSIDRFVPGLTAPRGALPAAICRDVGDLLAHLHSLKVEGHGTLENRRDRLVGTAPDTRSGIRTRFQDPWPFDASCLEQHPAARAAPHLIARLLPLRGSLLAHAAGAGALVHTDLHERQVLITEGRLSGLIDFGDVMVGAPAWDIASFAYFHGWALTEWLLEGYTWDTHFRDQLRAAARGLSLVIALHHASRAETLGHPHRLRAALTFLQAQLPPADPLPFLDRLE